MEESTQGKSNKTIVVIAVAFFLLLLGGIAFAVMNGGKESANQMETTKEEQPAGMETGKDATTSATEEQNVAGEVKTLSVEATSFAFSLKEIRVKKGDVVKVTVSNKAGMHDFVIDELNVRTKILKAGETEEVTIVADKIGTFEYYCSVGNHRQMGMVGTLIVE